MAHVMDLFVFHGTVRWPPTCQICETAISFVDRKTKRATKQSKNTSCIFHKRECDQHSSITPHLEPETRNKKLIIDRENWFSRYPHRQGP